MFAKCEMQMVNFMGTELHETEFYQCDLRKADFRDATGKLYPMSRTISKM